jgi:hypothetical protein
LQKQLAVACWADAPVPEPELVLVEETPLACPVNIQVTRLRHEGRESPRSPGFSGELRPVDVPVPTSKRLSSESLVPSDLGMALKEGSEEWRYIRLVASTRNSAKEEFRCYTNPIWIKATGE